MRNELTNRPLFSILACWMCFACAPALGATWTGAGATDDWNDFSNWSDNADPTGKDILFDGTVGSFESTAGTINNIITNSVNVGNLSYQANSTASEFHSTQINGGAVLTVSGFLLGFSSGTNSNSEYTVTGAGELKYDNSSGIFQFGVWSGGCCGNNRENTLDMSGLASFTMNASSFFVGRMGASTPLSVMTLADTNSITANTMDMSRSNDKSRLDLGRLNSLHINTINMVKVANQSATIKMQAGLTNPIVEIRDQSGTGGADLNMAINPNNTSGVSATIDLRGADVDAQFDQVLMGVGRPSAGGDTGTATISFDKGTMSMTNVDMAVAKKGGGNARMDVEGTAELTIDTITMANVSREGSATARFFVTDSGVLDIQALTMGNYTTGTITPVGNIDAQINLQGGTVRGVDFQAGVDSPGTNSRVINFDSGTIANRPGANLSVGAGIDVVLDTTGTHSVTAEAGQSISIDGVTREVAPGATGFTFNGAGTVLLNGASTLTGDSTLVSGVLGGNGSLAGHVQISGGVLNPGASAGIFNIGSGEIDSPGSLEIELGGTTLGTQYDQLQVTNALALGGTLEITLIDGFTPDFSDIFTVVDAGSLSGTFGSVLVTNTHANFDVIYNYGTGEVLLTGFQVPEPASFWLLLGVGGIALRRRRCVRRMTS